MPSTTSSPGLGGLTVGEVTPPTLHGPTSKERKYDRQLRLWAANGQEALENAHIFLINSGSGVAGIEALKNLVLPGIGRFTILDSALVKEEDLGVNFFLTHDDVGESRGQKCSHYLQELNPDVIGGHTMQPIEQFFGSQPEVQLADFTLILVTLPLAAEILEIICHHGNRNGIAVVYIHSVGFYSHFTVQLPSAFPIVDTHPDPNSSTDLRLTQPWPELVDLANVRTAQLDTMDNEQHGHIPYLHLILHYLEIWKASHRGSVPQGYEEKAEFRNTIKHGARSNPDGGEENFEEAVAAVLKNLNPPTASSAVKEVFTAPECQKLTSTSADFWIIAHAVGDFYRDHSVLPLSGSVPDMKAKSADYVELQNVYKSKAKLDIAEVADRILAIEKELKRTSAIELKDVEAFCRNAKSIKLIRGRIPHIPRPESMIQWNDRAKFAVDALRNPDSLISLYIAFLAYDSYVVSHTGVSQVGDQRPVSVESNKTETSKMVGIAHAFVDKLISEAGVFVNDPEYTEIKDSIANIITELVRAGSGELHNIAALTGGAVAQEVIKVITKQYVPVDNTFLFDGITSKSSVLRF